MTLNQSDESNRRVRILEIRGGAEITQQLAHLGVHAGDVVLIKRNAPMGGPLLLQQNGIEIAIGRNIARFIVVEDLC